LRIVSYELCRTASGNAHTRSNLKLTFNKPIALKEGTAEVTIFGSGILGGTFQKIDLRGTYSSKKYGDIYDAESSVIDNPDTTNNEAVSNNTIIINPTQQFKAASGYYLNIPAGVIIDASCDVPWEGITDTTTVAWQTDGAQATPPEALTYSSVFFDFDFNRFVVPGVGKLNIVAVSDGRLLAQIGATDYALKSRENFPVGYVERYPGILRIRGGGALTYSTASTVSVSALKVFVTGAALSTTATMVTDISPTEKGSSVINATITMTANTKAAYRSKVADLTSTFTVFCFPGAQIMVRSSLSL
jgi:hypothetical protein